MTFAILAYLAGVLTIVSPCILPVLPFVFARAGQPFLSGTLPMLLGMAATFAAVATLAAVGGGWAVDANEYGRLIAMIILAAFGVILLFPALAERVTRPVVALGARLSETADRRGRTGGLSGVGTSLLIGVATGLLWAPCAGPVLGLILTGAALNGASAGTTALLAAYALGAATSLALALLVGGRVYQAMKRSLGIGEYVRRGIGAAVLVAVVAIAFGLDTGFLTRISAESTTALEQSLIDRLQPRPQTGANGTAMAPSMSMQPAPGNAMTGADNNSMMMSGNPSMMMQGGPSPSGDAPLPVESIVPSFDGAVEWLNSPSLTMSELKGKVVLVDFWTYSCINCLRAIPYVRAWAEKYRDQGLVVIGVHSPEFAFEKRIDNVRRATQTLAIDYPVAVDNDYAIWRTFNNQYWPAHYFIDAEGRVRHHHFGEGEYEQSERVIQQLLAEAGRPDVAEDIVAVNATGAEAASNEAEVQSPETYIGYLRAQNFLGADGMVNDAAHVYTAETPRRNEWGLTGSWVVGPEKAALSQGEGSLYYRFHARDLHLVLGPGSDGKPVRFKVTIDGKPPGEDHGVDTDAEGNGTVTEQRLYQLVRQSGPVADRTFEIRFLDPGLEAYAFTFG
ncbi:cytochrome c biogenesis protein DipZ [Rhizobiaceae bacterium BDR2-2]|uniref:Cytochrome c biogenesis protein DipZ n=1 Tax=Ectorhizobium quercum TaxID=2965071 RepID=A0AAE3MXR1_9HYPH|nr:cytochrome c biogenesis protein DipZ [Ectorhizobium quercum]MCX8996237.1 cytochrome c biogenesis protein DipZ [Ectorhizobium quercum]MCX8998724.1 cytochrome c biogenesis protein DipZ [Ectorhizobium quercum]